MSAYERKPHYMPPEAAVLVIIITAMIATNLLCFVFPAPYLAFPPYFINLINSPHTLISDPHDIYHVFKVFCRMV